MIDRAGILAIVPHQGAMCLWDAVVAWDAQTIRLRTGTHRTADHPLRRDGRLHAVHLCEYGAQAMAVHGGLLARECGERAGDGMLVALRGVALHVARIDDLPGDLDCEAQALVLGTGGQQYAFRITHAGALLAEGRAAVLVRGG
jgi:predicted hotdog family 3-hydroxylacyl-ACP dehydratase